jgi:integrase
MARKHLTQQTVDRLKPGAKPIEIPDHLYPALRLIVHPSGARSFAVRGRIHGRQTKITLGKEIGHDLAKARAATRALLAEKAAGTDPRAARKRAKATTFEGVAELYLKHIADQVSAKTHGERTRHLTRDCKPLHRRPISEIRRGEVAVRLLEIKDAQGGVTANRARGTLHGLFEWALDHELAEINVVASVRRPLKHEPPRDRVLTPEERQEILAATADASAYSAIVRLLLLTLQRREEVGGMMWREVDLDKALWSLPASRTKNRLPHLVPLSAQAVEIIKAQPQCGEFVFGSRNGAIPFAVWSYKKRSLDRRLLAARRELDPQAEPMPSWRVHDLRRSGSTGMNDELDIPPHVVEAVINHVSGDAKRGVAGRYNKALYLRERTVALQRWADHLTGEPNSNVVELPAA